MEECGDGVWGSREGRSKGTACEEECGDGIQGRSMGMAFRGGVRGRVSGQPSGKE